MSAPSFIVFRYLQRYFAVSLPSVGVSFCREQFHKSLLGKCMQGGFFFSFHTMAKGSCKNRFFLVTLTIKGGKGGGGGPSAMTVSKLDQV